MDELFNTVDMDNVEDVADPEHVTQIITLLNELLRANLIYVIHKPHDLYFETIAEHCHPKVVEMMKELLTRITSNLLDYVPCEVTIVVSDFMLEHGVSNDELEKIAGQVAKLRMARMAKNN